MDKYEVKHVLEEAKKMPKISINDLWRNDEEDCFHREACVLVQDSTNLVTYEQRTCFQSMTYLEELEISHFDSKGVELYNSCYQKWVDIKTQEVEYRYITNDYHGRRVQHIDVYRDKSEEEVN